MGGGRAGGRRLAVLLQGRGETVQRTWRGVTLTWPLFLGPSGDPVHQVVRG